MYLVAQFLVSEGFCFLAEVSATAGELEACRLSLGGLPGILLCLCSCRTEVKGQKISSEH